MEISYFSKKLKKAFEIEKVAIKRWGPENGRILLRRHGQLKAAVSLYDFSLLPQVRCHPLTGNRKGQFACDGKHPFRLVFEPDHDVVAEMEICGVDLKKVTRIHIVEVVDYHD